MLKTTTSIINASQITGVLPVLNGGTGVTAKTGTGNVVLSAAPTLSGDVTLSTGNAIQGTAAKGINFTANTPSAGMTSQLLNWYEEGTWTPNQGSGLTVVGTFSSSGTYTRIGRQITLSAVFNGSTSIAVAANSPLCTNAPSAVAGIGLGLIMNGTGAIGGQCYIGGVTPFAIDAIAPSSTIYFNITYFI